jgi:hypothetical protein
MFKGTFDLSKSVLHGKITQFFVIFADATVKSSSAAPTTEFELSKLNHYNQMHCCTDACYSMPLSPYTCQIDNLTCTVKVE